ncbi:hypothetical protein [Streptomyces sp. NPDC026673]|uniref:hypothetical protein n=1 Tax=Streptomyces sp. NPDC026673 TaxID=3155724 RepID=UPI0034100831
MDPPAGGESDRFFVGALLLACASFVWRCSLIRVVLRPGEITRHGVWRHVVVFCADVKGLHRQTWRGDLVLETRSGEKVDFFWFDKSLWDVLYDFSDVCADAMRAHLHTASRVRPEQSFTGLQRRFTWSLVADPITASAVLCLGLGLFRP